ncbi:hypothetical protein EV561_1489 [Rhizobium sp. BK376]|nr:hypothetical protein EV561_1489 [Rhizobium sp. BK376]
MPMTFSSLRAFLLGLAITGLPSLCPTALLAAEQTIVFLRHGEKPDQGLGQLNCQGLNRSLAIPSALAKIFPKPSAIFAPNPTKQKQDDGQFYDYVRPLATIEPTAIGLGLPVNTTFGYDDIAGLKRALDSSNLANAVVFVVWEHKQIVKIARALIRQHGGDAQVVPKWRGDDFDSLYVVRIMRTPDGSNASFEQRQEGLDRRSEACPTP